MPKKYLAILVVGAIAIAGIFALTRDTRHAAQESPIVDGWYTSIDKALADPKDGPRIIVVTRAGWSSYEKSTYGHPRMGDVLDTLVRARVEFSDDTSRMEKWEIAGAPALVITNRSGEVITSLIGSRDVSFLRRAIERSIEFPFTPDELAARPDSASHLRWIEVLIERGDFDTAIEHAARYRGADTSAEFAHGQYLHGYALAEKGELDEARKAAEEYLARYPAGEHTRVEDRSAAQWMMIVLDLHADKDAAVAARIRTMIAEDSAAPHVRQAVWAYTMEYLARQKGELEKAESFLTKTMADSTPWTDDLRLARGALRLATPQTLTAAIDDFKYLAANSPMLAAEAKDRLVNIANAPGNDLLLADIILFFQELAARPDDGGHSRFLLARLYLASDKIDRAKAEAETVASSDGEYSDEALLLLGIIALEVEKTPDAALPKFDETIKKYPDRATLWPARYARSRALFFGGKLTQAKEANLELISYLEQRIYLPEAFLLVLPQAVPPQLIVQQLQEFNSKIDAITKEENGEDVFRELLKGILAAAKDDTPAARAAFENVTVKNPASSLADDALFELAKIHLRANDLESAEAALKRITESYKGSDQYEAAEQLLGMITQSRR